MVSGEKRNSEEENFMEKITAILLDIEGTTTSVSFVKDTLFPYVKENLESYVNSHWDDPEFKEDLEALKEQAKIDEEAKIEGFCPIDDEKESLVKNVLWQMSLDRKTTALKQLQGHIWREGYKNGKLKGHIYTDVVPAFKRWSEENRGIYIFSSGSVEAQKLLFGHSEEGDVLNYISGHYDTTIGPKNESNSYSNIIKSLDCEKEQVLFLTDVVKEAAAARSAGMQVALVVRDNNEPLTDDDKKEYMIITSFSDLLCENSVKRKKICDGSNGSNDDDITTDENSEKEIKNENADESQVNGSEAMEVDVANDEPKPESNQNTTEKTAEKTEEESKTETDEIEIDVVSEDMKEENAEVSTSNGGESAEPETASNSDGKEEDPKETIDSEPQEEATDPIPVADPLEITKDEDTTEENETKSEKEEKEDAEEQNNGTDDVEKREEKEENPEPSAEAEAEVEAEGEVEGEENAENGDTNADGNPTDETEGTNEKVAFPEDKEMNGHDENPENNEVDEEIAVNKIVPEDKPDPAVEVIA